LPPPAIIPFAEDTGGDLFCFDYRKSAETPSVVFWSAGTGIIAIAPDFTTFLDALHA